MVLVVEVSGDPQAQANALRRKIRTMLERGACGTLAEMQAAVASARTLSARAAALRPTGETWLAGYSDEELAELAGDVLMNVAAQNPGTLADEARLIETHVASMRTLEQIMLRVSGLVRTNLRINGADAAPPALPTALAAQQAPPARDDTCNRCGAKVRPLPLPLAPPYSPSHFSPFSPLFPIFP